MTADLRRCAAPAASLPLSVFEEVQVQGVIVRMMRTCAPPQFRFQLMSNAAGMQIAP
ncbi:hypothetical protein [Variovorax sp. YR266]|uniref:hypothetical protein n=1 Tax=Variovorax sp. YR266 TaxID=1884386 RepID=UPI0015A4BD2F|nr:hypothetical protein [Variovorax sp. YR266]